MSAGSYVVTTDRHLQPRAVAPFSFTRVAPVAELLSVYPTSGRVGEDMRVSIAVNNLMRNDTEGSEQLVEEASGVRVSWDGASVPIISGNFVQTTPTASSFAVWHLP